MTDGKVILPGKLYTKKQSPLKSNKKVYLSIFDLFSFCVNSFQFWCFNSNVRAREQKFSHTKFGYRAPNTKRVCFD